MSARCERNPYHLLVPAWMQDNVRRGGELVGGQGGAAPDFTFCTLYRLRRWRDGGRTGSTRAAARCPRHGQCRPADRLNFSHHLSHARESMSDCDAVLFDMDGTLVDSRELVERMWLRWAARRRVSAHAILAVAHGRRTLETMQLVAPEFATPEEAARLDEEEEEEARLHGGERAIPGAAQLLSALPRERWAVVTSAVRDIALRRIVGVGLPPPFLLVGAEDVTAGKPDPEGYLRAAEGLGCNPADCVVVEDTAAGVEAGLRAGAAVVGMLTTYPALEGCVACVRDLRAIDARVDASGTLRLRVQG